MLKEPSFSHGLRSRQMPANSNVCGKDRNQNRIEMIELAASKENFQLPICMDRRALSLHQSKKRIS